MSVITEDPKTRYNSPEQYRPDVLRELCVYFLNRLPYIELPELHQLCYNVDSESYRRNLRSVTGETYVAEAWGPRGIHIERLLREEYNEGERRRAHASR